MITITNDVQMVVKKALVLETVKGSGEIAKIQPGFYSLIKTGLTEINGDQLSETMRLLTTLINKRVLKIQKLATFGPMTNEIELCLSDEEKKLYNSVHETCTAFKGNIMVNKYV